MRVGYEMAENKRPLFARKTYWDRRDSTVKESGSRFASISISTIYLLICS